MPQSIGIEHIHQRKRVSQKLKPFPHRNPKIKFLDKSLVVIAILGPLMTFPQILKIYIEKNAAGISALSWSLFAVMNIPWIIYGIVHKNKPIIISNFGWFLTNILVLIGIIIY